MKAKVALLLAVLFVASIVTFGRGHERHERKFHKSELRSDRNKQDESRDYKFDRNHRKFDQEKIGHKKSPMVGKERFGHKESPKFNQKRFDRDEKQMIKRHNFKNKELSYFNNTILLPEVTVYAERI